MDGRFRTPPRGLICPLVTPLTADGRIDAPSLNRLLDHVGGGADALLLGDLSWGEAFDLGIEARLETVSLAVKRLAPELPIMVCVTGRSRNDTRILAAELFRLANRLACLDRLYTVDYPLAYHGNRDLPRTLADLEAGRGLPLIVGNDPDQIRPSKGPARHRNIRTAVLKKIAGNPRVRAMIFRGSVKRSLDYQQATRRRSDFLFYDADEAVFLNNPGMGGVVAGGSNLLPTPWQEIVRSCLNRYDTERQFRTHQKQMVKNGELARELYRLCRRAPAASMKQILFRVGLIGSKRTIRTEIEPPPEWTERLERFLHRWDLL